MSQRNTPAAKRERRVRRSLRKGRLPGYIDLIEWVQVRSRLSKGKAIKVIMAGALRVDSHTVGVKEIDGRKFFERHVPAHLRGRIQVVTPEVLRDA